MAEQSDEREAADSAFPKGRSTAAARLPAALFGPGLSMWKSLVALLAVLAGCGGNDRPTIQLNSDVGHDSLGARFASVDELESAMQEHRRHGKFFAAYLPDEYDENASALHFFGQLGLNAFCVCSFRGRTTYA